mgnify:CR=1 FL=1
MSSLAKHVIHQPKPLRTVMLVVFVVILTATVQWLFQQKQTLQQQKHTQELNEQIERLQKHNEQYTVTSEQHYSQLSLEQATTGQLRKELTQLQEQVLTLNKDLQFYQSITKGSTSSKLQIRELHLRPDDVRPDIIRYRLVISQGKKINKPITGTINMVLNSESKLEPQTLKPQKLNLRHVQVLEGKIKLTDDVKPLTITVELIQNKKVTLSRTFNWQLSPNN